MGPLTAMVPAASQVRPNPALLIPASASSPLAQEIVAAAARVIGPEKRLLPLTA